MNVEIWSSDVKKVELNKHPFGERYIELVLKKGLLRLYVEDVYELEDLKNSINDLWEEMGGSKV